MDCCDKDIEDLIFPILIDPNQQEVFINACYKEKKIVTKAKNIISQLFRAKSSSKLMDDVEEQNNSLSDKEVKVSI